MCESVRHPSPDLVRVFWANWNNTVIVLQMIIVSRLRWVYNPHVPRMLCRCRQLSSASKRIRTEWLVRGGSPMNRMRSNNNWPSVVTVRPTSNASLSLEELWVDRHDKYWRHKHTSGKFHTAIALSFSAPPGGGVTKCIAAMQNASTFRRRQLNRSSSSNKHVIIALHWVERSSMWCINSAWHQSYLEL